MSGKPREEAREAREGQLPLEVDYGSSYGSVAMRIPRTSACSQVRTVDNRSSIIDNCTKFSYATAQLH